MKKNKRIHCDEFASGPLDHRAPVVTPWVGKPSGEGGGL